MTSDTHGNTRYIWMGVIKRQQRRSSIDRVPKQNQIFNGGKGVAALASYKRKHPITLATKPFDHTEGD